MQSVPFLGCVLRLGLEREHVSLEKKTDRLSLLVARQMPLQLSPARLVE